MSEAQTEPTHITRVSRARVEELGNHMAEFADSMKLTGSCEAATDYERASSRYLFVARLMEEQGLPFIENESLNKALSFEVQSPSQMTGAAMVKAAETAEKPKPKLLGWLRRKKA